MVTNGSNCLELRPAKIFWGKSTAMVGIKSSPTCGRFHSWLRLCVDEIQPLVTSIRAAAPRPAGLWMSLGVQVQEEPSTPPRLILRRGL